MENNQWREAANVLREFANQFDEKADKSICGVILPYATPDNQPVACAYKPEHTSQHSWAMIPTITFKGGKE